MLEKEVQKGKKITHQRVGETRAKEHFKFIGSKNQNKKNTAGPTARGDHGSCAASSHEGE